VACRRSRCASIVRSLARRSPQPCSGRAFRWCLPRAVGLRHHLAMPEKSREAWEVSHSEPQALDACLQPMEAVAVLEMRIAGRAAVRDRALTGCYRPAGGAFLYTVVGYACRGYRHDRHEGLSPALHERPYRRCCGRLRRVVGELALRDRAVAEPPHRGFGHGADTPLLLISDFSAKSLILLVGAPRIKPGAS
jgi:hypothetical protein